MLLPTARQRLAGRALVAEEVDAPNVDVPRHRPVGPGHACMMFHMETMAGKCLTSKSGVLQFLQVYSQSRPLTAQTRRSAFEWLWRGFDLAADLVWNSAEEFGRIRRLNIGGAGACVGLWGVEHGSTAQAAADTTGNRDLMGSGGPASSDTALSPATPCAPATPLAPCVVGGPSTPWLSTTPGALAGPGDAAAA